MFLSVELRSNHVFLVEAKVSKSVIQILRTHDYDFPDAWANDLGIIETDAFSKRLTRELAEHKFTAKKTHLCLNNNTVLFRELSIPKVDPRRVPLLVRSEMMSSLNLTPNYIMDHVELEEISIEGNPYIRVLAIATLGSVLESVVKTFTASKLKLLTIDSSTNSIIKLIGFTGVSKPDEQIITADIGVGYLRLFLFDGGKYVLSRNTKLLVDGDETRTEIINTIDENLNKMIQFSFTRNTQQEIKKIYLTGEDDLLDDVKQKLIENHDIPCDILNYHEMISGSIENKFANALGTLIRK